jgi:hypothetical protein
VAGSVRPLTLKPVPEALACEIETLELPVLVRVTFCVLVVPRETFPKLRLVGLAESNWLDEAPVPLTLMVVGALLALLATVMVPVSAPAAVGAKLTFMLTLCPAARYRGNESPLALKAGAEELTPESVIVAFPVLLSTTTCEPLLPMETLPRFKVAGLAEITPA